MAALALSDFLQDFGRRPLSHAEAPPPPVELAPVAFGPTPEEELQQKIAEAVAAAEAALTERLSRVYEDTLQAERDNHAAEVAELRTVLGTDAGALIAARLGDVEAGLVELTTATAARILGAFAGAEMQKKTIERLAGLIRDSVRDREIVRIEVRGPRSLFEPLEAALGDKAASIDFVEDSGFDLAVAIDGSLFETRLGEWSTSFEEAFA
ncbi:MAG: hypothetical protein AB7I52_05845 [Rhizobiaceae bacterium]